MDIITENGVGRLKLEYPITRSFGRPTKLYVTHEELADLIAENKWKTMMVVTACDHLADEHWDDPKYMHKTNHIIVPQAQEEARKELTNRYFSDEKIKEIMVKYEMPDWEHNFKEEDGRAFKFRLQDEIFSYQEQCEMFEIITSYMDDCKYKMDEYGYIIQNEETDEYELEPDKEKVEQQKKIMLEKLLIPRIRTEHNRVYDMPDPFNHWDYRSSFHSGFYVLNEEEKSVYVDMGGSGSSGRRETNGRWCHAFAQLAHKYGIETPTIFMRYDPHNVWKEEFRLPTFAAVGRELSGNYQSKREVMDVLFKGRVYHLKSDDKYVYTYEKLKDDLYY